MKRSLTMLIILFSAAVLATLFYSQDKLSNSPSFGGFNLVYNNCIPGQVSFIGAGAFKYGEKVIRGYLFQAGDKYVVSLSSINTEKEVLVCFLKLGNRYLLFHPGPPTFETEDGQRYDVSGVIIHQYP